jgi:hypothetical protein
LQDFGKGHAGQKADPEKWLPVVATTVRDHGQTAIVREQSFAIA